MMTMTMTMMTMVATVLDMTWSRKESDFNGRGFLKIQLLQYLFFKDLILEALPPE